MFPCAQLNAFGVCFCVAVLADEVQTPHIIPLDSAEEKYLGKKYVNGLFYGLQATVNGAEIIVSWRDLDGNLVDESETVTAKVDGVEVQVPMTGGRGSFTIEAAPGTYQIEIVSASGCCTTVEVTVQ